VGRAGTRVGIDALIGVFAIIVTFILHLPN
jgi:hypothetical protein